MTAAAQPEQPGQAPDLMAALRASIEAARRPVVSPAPAEDGQCEGQAPVSTGKSWPPLAHPPRWATDIEPTPAPAAGIPTAGMCTCGDFAGTSVRYADCPVHGDPAPITVIEEPAEAQQGYTVELGGQMFTQAQWETVQTYIEGSPAESLPDAASWSPDEAQHDGPPNETLVRAAERFIGAQVATWEVTFDAGPGAAVSLSDAAHAAARWLRAALDPPS